MLLQHCPPKAEECGLPYCALHPPPRSQLAPLHRTGLAFVSRRCAFLLSFKCTMQDPKPRCIQNETDSRKSYGSIPVSLLYLTRVLRIHTNHPVRAEEKPGTDSPTRVLNQRCYMRLASFIQILIREICNKPMHALIKNSSNAIIFIVTYISVNYWCLGEISNACCTCEGKLLYA